MFKAFTLVYLISFFSFAVSATELKHVSHIDFDGDLYNFAKYHDNLLISIGRHGGAAGYYTTGYVNPQKNIYNEVESGNSIWSLKNPQKPSPTKLNFPGILVAQETDGNIIWSLTSFLYLSDKPCKEKPESVQAGFYSYIAAYDISNPRTVQRVSCINEKEISDAKKIKVSESFVAVSTHSHIYIYDKVSLTKKLTLPATKDDDFGFDQKGNLIIIRSNGALETRDIQKNTSKSLNITSSMPSKLAFNDKKNRAYIWTADNQLIAVNLSGKMKILKTSSLPEMKVKSGFIAKNKKLYLFGRKIIVVDQENLNEKVWDLPKAYPWVDDLIVENNYLYAIQHFRWAAFTLHAYEIPLDQQQ